MKLLKTFILLIACIIMISQSAPAAEEITKVSGSDKEYLQGVYKATFRCISFFVNKKTGLPYDVSDSRKPTSLTNIGLYLASVAVASRTELLSKEEAVKRIDQTLSSLEKAERWRGFPVSWVNVDTGKLEFGPRFSYADHVGNLICGLLVVAGTFPEEFGQRIDTLIQGMDFASTYDSETGWLKGGYDMSKKEFDVKQSWGNWYNNLLASDTRHFSLFGIALGKIPEAHWHRLVRETMPAGRLDMKMVNVLFPDRINDMPYYAPGMDGGGLFMQYLPGIFLSEKELPMGASARNFARCQIELAKKENIYPFWGFSACESPDGRSYIGWGRLKETLVTPHASILAVSDYPKETIEALQALESKGTRARYKDDFGIGYDFGFTDSYDVVSEQASRNYLMLDQCMAFLSLANFLYDDIARKSFDKSPLGHTANQRMKGMEEKYKAPEFRRENGLTSL